MTIYKNLTYENSTIMNVLRSGIALCNIRQELVTKKGKKIVYVNSTYPLKENDKIVGAIEFSKHYYTKNNAHSLERYTNNKIFRKNNTIYTIDDIITMNTKMDSIKNKIMKIANTDSTVLIVGRTGTGKEVVAQAVHNLSNRFAKPFISLNCGAVPPNLLEATLF